jgi:TonB family protein
VFSCATWLIFFALPLPKCDSQQLRLHTGRTPRLTGAVAEFLCLNDGSACPISSLSFEGWSMRFARMNFTARDGEDIRAPEPLHKVDPSYPASYVHDRVESTVVLYGVIRSDGSMGNLPILVGFDSVLDENARAALEKWHFRPGTRNGIPVDVEIVVHVPFRVPRSQF